VLVETIRAAGGMSPLRDFVPIGELVARVVGRVMRRQREMAYDRQSQSKTENAARRGRGKSGAPIPRKCPTREAGTDHPAGWRFR
jgi:hypothetical protein